MDYIDMSPLQGDAEDWLILERRAARNRLMSYMISFDDEIKREQVLAKLTLSFLADFEGMSFSAGKAGRREKQLMRYDREWITENERNLIESESLSAYYAEFTFSQDMPNKDVTVRSMLTVGLIATALIMFPKFNLRPTLNSVVDFIADTHSGNKLFLSNRNQVKALWSRAQNVSHLGAAFYSVMLNGKRRKFSEQDFLAWEFQMERFIRIAIFFQVCLLRLAETSKQPPISSLRFLPFDLYKHDPKDLAKEFVAPKDLEIQIQNWAKK